MSQQFGEIDSNKTYHVKTFVSIFQLKDVRTAVKYLDQLEVKYVRFRGQNIWIAGSEFLLAVQRFSAAGGYDPSESEAT